jgi:hypothetical protein
MEIDPQHCVTLEAACSVLCNNSGVQSMLKKKIEDKDFKAALDMMKAGKFDGDLGDLLNDLLDDFISNNSTVAWSGFTHHPHGNYTLTVNEYDGVYWVHAIEFDSIGYFLNQDDAVSFAYFNWENVYADGEDPNGDEEN